MPSLVRWMRESDTFPFLEASSDVFPLSPPTFHCSLILSTISQAKARKGHARKCSRYPPFISIPISNNEIDASPTNRSIKLRSSRNKGKTVPKLSSSHEKRRTVTSRAFTTGRFQTDPNSDPTSYSTLISRSTSERK